MKLYSDDYFVERILRTSEPKLKVALYIKDKSYELIRVPKKDGTRVIAAIKNTSALYRLQKNLMYHFLNKIPVADAAKGFLKGYSYTDFLYPHINNQYFLRLDIKDFFDSVTMEQVIEELQPFVLEPKIMRNILKICFLNGRLPQGFLTSPVLSNIVFRRIDQRIIKYCRCFSKNNIVYTRYADDLLFSSKDFDFQKKLFFKKKINYILSSNHFKLNETKTIFAKDRISLSGYVVEHEIRLSRKKLHTLNTILHFFDKRGRVNTKKYRIKNKRILGENFLNEINQMKLTKSDGNQLEFKNLNQLIHFLCGYRSFLISILKVNEEGTEYFKILQKKLDKIETIIVYLSKIQDEEEYI